MALQVVSLFLFILFFYHAACQGQCSMPNRTQISNLLNSSLLQDGYFLKQYNFSCLAVGNRLYTYRSASVVANIENPNGTEKTHQFEIECQSSFDSWNVSSQLRNTSLNALTLTTKYNCSRCNESDSDDNACIGKLIHALKMR
jgi:hypothetical protein